MNLANCLDLNNPLHIKFKQYIEDFKNESSEKKKLELEKAQEEWKADKDEKGLPNKSWQQIEKQIVEKYNDKNIEITATNAAIEYFSKQFNLPSLTQTTSSSNVETKKADIERRRQYSLENIQKSKQDATQKGAYYPSGYSIIEGIATPYDETGKVKKTEEKPEYQPNSNTEKLKEWINAKYDAELAELEKTNIPFKEQIKNPISTLTNVEKQKSIDKLREEGEDLLQLKSLHSESQSVGKEEIEFIKNTFGEDVLNHLTTVINSNAYGVWKNAVITLYQDAKRGTGYHEAWHHFSQMYLTKEQKKELYKQVNELKPEILSYKDAEEYLADQFMRFKLEGKTDLPNKTIFQKILDFIKWVFLNQPSIERAFTQLSKGKLYHYNPTMSNVMFGKLNASVKNSKGKIVFDSVQTSKFTKHLHWSIGKLFRDNGISISILENRDMETYNILYNLIKEDFQQQYPLFPDITKEELKTAFEIEQLEDESYVMNEDSFQSFVTAALEKLNYFPKEEDTSDETKEDADQDDDFNPEQEDIEEVRNSDKFDKEQKSVIEESAPSIRKLISMLPKGQVIELPDGKYEITEYSSTDGLKQTADPIRVYSLVSQHLQGSLNLDEMMERLSDEMFHLRLPEAKFLYDQLNNSYKDGDGKPVAKQSAKDLMQQFYSTFNRIYVPVYTAIQLETKNEDGSLKSFGNFIIKEQTKDVADKVRKQWQNELLLKGGIVPKNIFVPSVEKGTITIQELKKFTDDLGLVLSENTLKSPEIKEFINGDYEISSDSERGYIFYFADSLRKRLNKGQEITNLFKDMNSPYQGIEKETRFLYKLLDIESKYSDQFSTMMVKTAKGTKKYGLMLPSYFNRIGSVLRDRNLINLPEAFKFLNKKNNPYVTNSVILNTLFNNTGAKKLKQEFIFGDYNGAKFKVLGTKEVTKQSTDMSPLEKFIMDIHMLLLDGKIDIPRTESSGTSYFIASKFYDLPMSNGRALPRAKVPFSLEFLYDQNEEFDSTAYDIIGNVFTGYLADELLFSDKISLMKDFVNENSVLEYVKTIEKDKDFTKKIKLKFKNTIAKNIKSYLETEADILLQDYQLKGNISDQLREIKAYNGETISLSDKSIVKAFLLNDLFLKSEYTKIFEGPLHQFESYHKRAKTAISTGIEMDTSDHAAQMLTLRKQNTLRHLLDPTSEPYRHDVLKTRLLKEDESSLPAIRIERIKKEISAIGKLKNYSEKKIQELKQNLSKAWSKKMKVGDGGGYITLDGYRQVLEQTGNWQGKDLSLWYRSELLIFKRDFLNKPLTEQETKMLEEGQKVNVSVPSLKLQYTGPSASKEKFTPIVHKFALAPLFPSLVKNNPVLRQLMMDMVNNGEVYSYFESSSKKVKEGKPFPIYDGERKNYSDETYTNSPEVFATYLKEQIKTNFELKESTTWGTQMRKLFLANLFNSGETIENISKIYDEYLDVLQNFANIERVKLLKQFGAKYDDNRIIVEDRKRFIESLIHEAKKEGVTQNVIDSIGYDEVKKDFINPLDFNANTAAIQDLISGIVFKRVVRAKTNGDMLIQVPSSGYNEELDFYKLEIDKDGNPVRVIPAQCKIALTEKHAPLLNLTHPDDGQKIETRERLNEAIKNKEWFKQHEKHLTIISYRIPTQGPNSIEVFTVQEFLPKNFGNGIVVPKEIVVKSGSDYDIDKLPSIFPSFDKYGNLIDDVWSTKYDVSKEIKILEEKIKNFSRSSKLISSVYENSEEILKQLQEDETREFQNLNNELQDLVKEYKRNVKLQKDYWTNKALNVYIKVFTNPLMYDQLITPNDVSNVKPIAKKMVKALGLKGYDNEGQPLENKNTDIVKYSVNLVKYIQFLSGKKDLGVYALGNTFSQLLQIAGVKLNENYRIRKQTYKQDNPFYYIERTITLPFLKEKSLELGKVDLEDGIPKQQILSELINSTVDIAADPYYSALGINNYNKGVVINMLMQNNPFASIIAFINQPILREYYSRLQKQPYYDVNGKVYPTTNFHAKKLLGFTKAKDMWKNLEKFDFKKEDYLSIEDLEKTISSETMDKRMLAHFLKQKEQADILRKAQQTLSFDTKKFFTPIGAYSSLMDFEDVMQTGLFSEEMRKIKERSLVSAFDSRQTLIDLYENILPLAYQKEFVEKTRQKMFSVNIFNRVEQYSFERTIANDFIDFMTKKYGVVRTEGNPVNFSEYVKTLLNKTSENNLSKRLIELQKSNKELFEKYSILSYLRSNESEERKNIINIEIATGKDNPVDQQDRMAEEFEQLINFDNPEYSSEELLKIRKFARDLAYIGIGQSGFNKSFLYFGNIIPTSFIEPFLKEVKENYQNSSLMLKDIETFLKYFDKENPKYGLSKKPYKETWRGKYLYDFTQDLEYNAFLEKQVEEMDNEEVGVDSTGIEATTTKQKIPFLTEQSLKQKGTFRTRPLLFQKIESDRDKPVGARRQGNNILINFDELKKKYNEKAWIKSATLSDGSKATPLSENEFNSFEEFLTFVLIYEEKHFTILQGENEKKGEYEDRINQAALADLSTNYRQTSENNFPNKQIDIQDNC